VLATFLVLLGCLYLCSKGYL